MDHLVRKIVVDIATSFARGAGTRGMVFLGLGGREFRLDIEEYEDFDRGDEVTYQLGEDANVRRPERNDPRQGFPLTVEDVAGRPAYIRLVPHESMLGRLIQDESADDWNVAHVGVRVVSGGEEMRFSALDGPQENIWLGPQSGNTLHLTRRA